MDRFCEWRPPLFLKNILGLSSSAAMGPWTLRLRAGAAHLGLSLVLAGILLALVTHVWFPRPFFQLAGGRDIFLLLLCCDLILGPVLTLVVFDIGKQRAELFRDLAIVAFVQLAALTYGLWSLLQVRPAFIVYNNGQFNVTLANEIINDKQTTADPSATTLTWFGPKLFAARLPDDAEDRNRITMSAVQGRGDVYQMPRYFVPYGSAKSEVAHRARTPEKIADELRLPIAEVIAASVPYAKPGFTVGLLPLVVRTNVALAVVNRETGDLLGISTVSLGRRA